MVVIDRLIIKKVNLKPINLVLIIFYNLLLLILANIKNNEKNIFFSSNYKCIVFV